MTTQQFHRHHRRCLDAATSHAYAELRGKGGVRAAFAGLLAIVSGCSDLMSTPRTADGRFLQIEALRNLAAFHREFSGDPSTWPGGHGHVLTVVGSLARHVLGRYPIPTFLGSVWFGADKAGDRDARRWFVAHARGQRFRSLALPMVLTRKMEHVFLHGPDHLDLVASMRRAEVIGSGGSPELAAAVIATRLGRTIDRPDPWRPLIELFAHCEADLELAQVPRVVEYLASLRDVRLEIHTPGGVVIRRAEQPTISPERHRIAALVEAAAAWHSARLSHGHRRSSWPRSRWHDFTFEVELAKYPPRCVRWQIVELLDSHALVEEGYAMRNCVATYAYRCVHGGSRIWSLRRQADRDVPKSLLTIEIDPRRAAIVQVKGPRNRRGTPRALELLRLWATREQLEYAGG